MPSNSLVYKLNVKYPLCDTIYEQSIQCKNINNK